MPKSRFVPLDIDAFKTLGVRMVTVAGGDAEVALHLSGSLCSTKLPLVCVPGYQRNMSDFLDFLPHFRAMVGADWPVVLVDLRGRGRSRDRARVLDYGSPNDAVDLLAVITSLGIERAILLGQGYGGQVIMALGAMRPAAIAGAILVDAGPASVPASLVRLRSNLKYIASLQGRSGLTAAFNRMLAADYPCASEDRLAALAGRTHFIDARARACPLFDPALTSALEAFDADDALLAQWPLFDNLHGARLALIRTELTDQILAADFAAMIERRPDAVHLIIGGEGSPALFSRPADVAPIANFVKGVAAPGKRVAPGVSRAKAGDAI